MEISDVPGLNFETAEDSAAKYRVLKVDLKPKSNEFILRTWKAPKGAFSESKSVIEEDEPVSAICGVENPFAGIFEDEDESEEEVSGMTLKDGRWIVEREFSHHFHKSAFGRRLSKLSTVEREYDSKIVIAELDRLRLESRSKLNLTKLMTYLSEKSSVSKLKFTHFICLPLINSPEVESSLSSLADQITDPGFRCAVVSPKKLHFTLAMLKLENHSDFAKVKSILQSYSGYLSNNPLVIDLKGIGTMDDAHPENLRVAYTGVQGGDGPEGWRTMIGRIANGLFEKLSSQGLLDSKQPRSYYNGTTGTLHATIVNTKYAARLVPGELTSSDSEAEARDKISRQEWTPGLTTGTKNMKGLDGRQFLTQFRDFYFGSVKVNEIRLCSLVEVPGVVKDPNGFYQTLLAIRL
ncbi:hypothetical protein C9890_0034 [Perkinsus sp. BL_2016]|nr:hypothetical protein C9890_0034 [Perkinsus sp. BL_2016]